jgi:two-component system nitrate/nitrite response regulator NarL
MSSSPVDLRTLIVADDPLARTGLATLLAGQPGCIVTGQVSGEADLEAALEVFGPDVVVWDLGWNPEPALERLAGLGEAGPPVVVLLPEEIYTADARAAGASGLLPREVRAEHLAAALAAVAQGLVVLDPALAGVLLPAEGVAPEPLIEDLTPRELQVLQLLAEGLSNKAIAYRLDISEHTVKFHVNAIMSKLGAQSRTEAAVRATRMGLILL